MRPLFVTGIGTHIGKTVVAAILTEALGADYWKPIQAGELLHTDTMKVAGFISHPQSTIHPETYRLSLPMSPHIAAEQDGITIDLDQFLLPVTHNRLIIEGAGGLLVPLNKDALVIDLIKKLDAEVILVSRHYLGSINHTLLSALALRHYHIPVRGIIFNGSPAAGTEAIILAHTGYPLLGRVNEETIIDKAMILRYAASFSNLYNNGATR